MATLDERLHLLEMLDLKNGGHNSFDEGVCAMEALAWLAGEPHSDKPTCACPVIAAFMREWNDQLPDDAARNRWLKPLLPGLLNTAGTPEVQIRRAFACADFAVRVMTPRALDAAAAALEAAGIADHPAKLRECAANLRALPPIADESTARSADAAAEAASAAKSAESAWVAKWAARSAARASTARSSAAESSAAESAWAAKWAARSAEWAAEWADADNSNVDAIRHETQEFVRRLAEIGEKAA